MSNARRRTGISRRDFVHGRFWGLVRLQQGELDQCSVDNAAEAAKQPARRSLVMRYPKTIREVAAGDRVANRQGQEPIAPISARRRSIPVFRPPGAIEEANFLEGCTRCDKCIQACPHDAIVHAPNRLREAAGTPIIDPDHQPCLMCRDFPCIAACQPNVLTHLVPKMMGTAKVTEHLCLAHHGTTCTVCSERCPVENVIEITDGKPTIDEKSCTGCGVCRYVCPAPENAILLMPSFLRPSPNTSQSR